MKLILGFVMVFSAFFYIMVMIAVTLLTDIPLKTSLYLMIPPLIIASTGGFIQLRSNPKLIIQNDREVKE